MLYDLNCGVALKVSDQLGTEFSNILPKRQYDSKYEPKIVVECYTESCGLICIEYKGILYKCNRKNWLAQFFQLLPDIYRLVLPGYIFFHGSCLRINNKIVFLLGSSRSGKSTALFYLINYNVVKYISDDIIIIEPIKKHILPLGNKPIQIREDVVATNVCNLTDDAWNMHKIAYVYPKNIETEILQYDKCQIIFCFIHYDKTISFEVKNMKKYQLINSLFRCCYNLSEVSMSIIFDIMPQDIRAIDIKYDGNINNLFTFINN